MRTIEQSLASRRDDDIPLVQVLGISGSVSQSYSYAQVLRAAAALASTLRTQPAEAADGGTAGRAVGLVMGNSPAFVIADLALLAERQIEVPVPLAFTAEQAASMLGTVDLCLVDVPGLARLEQWGVAEVLPTDCQVQLVDPEELLAQPLAEPLFSNNSQAPADDWICKIIHTSGTTSRPKGVRIRSAGLEALIASLRRVLPLADEARRYLSLVPLSLLIEQVSGLYLVMTEGGTLNLLPTETSLVGSTASAPQQILPIIAGSRPTALVISPAIAEAFAAAADALAQAEVPVLPGLFGRTKTPLICCGGAPVDVDVLTRLAQHGVDIYEGYGLSENSSVVSWNVPGANRPGTVGRPLEHVQVRCAEDGELLVKSSSLFAGYTRTDPSSCFVDDDGWLHTGDLARIDADGYLRIVGRKKSVIITAAGRNISPEWVEAQYVSCPLVHAVAVVGDGFPELHGLFMVGQGVTPDQVLAQIEAYGKQHLSEVERVKVAHLVPDNEGNFRRFFTVTGRPRREVVREAIVADTLPPITLDGVAGGGQG
ncbi:AMP-binding protein [Streptomyces sp. NPDC005122]